MKFGFLGCGRFRHGGENDAHAGAGTLLGIDAEVAAVHARQGVGDGQAKASTLVALVERGIDLAEGTMDYTITVTNQGSVASGLYSVIDHLAIGTVLSGAATPAQRERFHSPAFTYSGT